MIHGSEFYLIDLLLLRNGNNFFLQAHPRIGGGARSPENPDKMVMLFRVELQENSDGMETSQ